MCAEGVGAGGVGGLGALGGHAGLAGAAAAKAAKYGIIIFLSTEEKILSESETFFLLCFFSQVCLAKKILISMTLID